MNRFTKLLAATAAGAALSFAAAASQAAVFISFDGSTDLFTQADGGYDFNAVCGAICGGFETVHITGDTGSAPTLLHSQAVNLNTGHSGNHADVTIYVTHTDISGPMPSLGYISSFATNNSTSSTTDIFHTPFTITLSTYADASNGKYVGGTLLSSFVNNTPGSASSNQFAASLGTNPGLYSVTEKYVIHAANNAGDASATSSIILNGFNTAVPEPATWALMIMGFGGAGAMLRRRRTQAAAI